MKPLILSVEDDLQMTSLLRTMFEISDYPLIQAKTAKEALTRFLSDKPDLVVLDLGLPDADGLEVIRKIRSFSQAPILVLSARSEPADKIQALDLGADDYLAKPFSVDELLARIRVICRRLDQTGTLPEAAVFRNGGLEIRYGRPAAASDSHGVQNPRAVFPEPGKSAHPQLSHHPDLEQHLELRHDQPAGVHDNAAQKAESQVHRNELWCRIQNGAGIGRYRTGGITCSET